MAGYVYLIGTPTFRWYKIGKSITPDVRIKNIGVLLPFKIEVLGIWRAADHTMLESCLHEKYAESRVNGEWFSFSKKEVYALFDSLPAEARIYPSANTPDSVFATFSNLERDCPEDCTVRFKIKKMRGDLTPEQRIERKNEAIRKQQEKRAQKEKPAGIAELR